MQMHFPEPTSPSHQEGIAENELQVATVSSRTINSIDVLLEAGSLVGTPTSFGEEQWKDPQLKDTVDGESFAGLNFCRFNPMKYFVEILLWLIGQERLCYINNY